MKKIKYAFTLVELIVVITILTILWTIAFFSLQWYSTQASNSSRISDLWLIKTSLELFQLDAWKYPLPSNYSEITYSWSIVWKQWSFWNSAYSNVTRLDKIPKDPVFDKEYTYSISSSMNNYQLWWILEWSDIIMNWNISNLYAWDNLATAYVIWNYDWLVTRTNTWNTCNILSVPSIITNDTSNTDLLQILANNSFVYRWYNNLPSTFNRVKYKYDWWFTFSPNNVLVYSNTLWCDVLSNSLSERIKLFKNIQNSYSWSIISNESNYLNLLNVVVDENNPSEELKNISWNIVEHNLWYNKLQYSLESINTCSSTWSLVLDYTWNDQYFTVPNWCKITAKIWWAWWAGWWWTNWLWWWWAYATISNFDLWTENNLTFIVWDGWWVRWNLYWWWWGWWRSELIKWVTRVLVAWWWWWWSWWWDLSWTNWCNWWAWWLTWITWSSCVNAWWWIWWTQSSWWAWWIDYTFWSNWLSWSWTFWWSHNSSLYWWWNLWVWWSYWNWGRWGGWWWYYWWWQWATWQFYNGWWWGWGGSSFLISSWSGLITAWVNSLPWNSSDTDRWTSWNGWAAWQAGNPWRIVISWY